MSTLGPYLLYANKFPIKWCYFDLSDLNHIAYYESSFPSGRGAVNWIKTQPAENTPLYVYDPIHQKSACHIMIGEKLYRVPINKRGNEETVNQIEQPRVTDSDIKWDLASIHKKARDFGVDIHRFPTGSAFETRIPELPKIIMDPADNSAIKPWERDVGEEQKPQFTYVDMRMARDLLQIHQYTCVENRSQSPVSLADGTLYAWNEHETWHFHAGFLGKTQTGVFDENLDKNIIDVLSHPPLHVMQSIQGLQSMSMSRPLLKLNPAQQNRVTSTMYHDWPLSSNMSAQDQTLVCRSIVEGKLLSDNIALNANIYSFRPYLSPEAINHLFKRDFYSAEEKEPTIADIIVYVNYLLVAAARNLGDNQPLAIKQPPEASDVKCGDFANPDPSLSLTDLGLSEEEGLLFQRLLTYRQGVLTQLSNVELLWLYEQVEHLSDLPNYPELMNVANNLLAAIAAEMGTSPNESQHYLEQLYAMIFDEMLPLPIFKALEKFKESSLMQHRDVEAIWGTIVKSTSPINAYHALYTMNLGELLDGDKAGANRDKIAAHKALEELVQALETLYTSALLLRRGQQQFLFNAVVNHERPVGVANALIDLRSQDIFIRRSQELIDHESLGNMVLLLRELQKMKLLTDPNWNAISRIKCLNYKETKKLISDIKSGPGAQDTFDHALQRYLHQGREITQKFKNANLENKSDLNEPSGPTNQI